MALIFLLFLLYFLFVPASSSNNVSSTKFLAQNHPILMFFIVWLFPMISLVSRLGEISQLAENKDLSETQKGLKIANLFKFNLFSHTIIVILTIKASLSYALFFVNSTLILITKDSTTIESLRQTFRSSCQKEVQQKNVKNIT